jgi:hypothetical protein
VVRNPRTWLAGAAAFAVTAGVSWGITVVRADDRSPAGGGGHAAADDIAASQTATDWVAKADYVVSVTVMSEKEVAMSEEEQQNGEGFMPREVTLRVDKVVWSTETPSHQPPAVGSTILWRSAGWTVHDGERTAWVDPDRPLLKTGHSYLEAIWWMDEAPDGISDVDPQWKGLGEGSSLPFDEGVIGKGENAGEIVSPTTFRKMEAEPGTNSLEQQLAGKGAADLAAALNAADPSTEPPSATSEGEETE